ncbi:hypothetical protein EFU41_18510 [Vibrio cholerae]|nr:hypothetical protein [Vibrio cholerae]EKG0043096.1 hypothetical protein [Vibrio cholerae]ELR6565841.1 hypothetical protein [Vibrio cholerae]
MIETVSYRNIVATVRKEQNRFIGRVTVLDSVDPVSSKLMVEINSKTKRHSLVAVLFCNPSTPFAKDEIIPSLNYFHKRSKQYINIFCCGFGAFGRTSDYPDMQQVGFVDGNEWFYSDEAFVTVVEEFEERTKWQYSGENELLLLDIVKNNDIEDLTIQNAIVCNLEQMHRDKAFTSVRSLIEKLIVYAKSDEAANAWKFSDKQGLNVAKGVLKDAILNLLPNDLKNLYQRSENYAVKQI